MDDRFDRRELLLHLGDILEAANRLARGSAQDTPVTQRTQEDATLRELRFLPTLAAEMTVSEFSAAVTSAFSGWPRELLETELNRDALALAVQVELFAGNPIGWNAYVAYVQKKVPWFGVGLPEVTETASAAEREQRSEKTGWPWPEPKTTA